ncbi:MAG: type II toxin-antitoxin system VapC family toxin [Candidatus Thermoplasmatota archaeon]|nr:type II toxin-antitoxin system VapC family toxin [Candidatus Thermoplasmatota archaeon]
MPPILDTNVLINIVKGDKKTKDLLYKHKGESASITVVNRYEFLRGVYSSIPQGAKRDELFDFLDQFKVYDFTTRTASYCAEAYYNLRNNGSLINELDIIILGICLENSESILTSDRDFIKAAEITGTKLEII